MPVSRGSDVRNMQFCSKGGRPCHLRIYGQRKTRRSGLHEQKQELFLFSPPGFGDGLVGQGSHGLLDLAEFFTQ